MTRLKEDTEVANKQEEVNRKSQPGGRLDAEGGGGGGGGGGGYADTVHYHGRPTDLFSLGSG